MALFQPLRVALLLVLAAMTGKAGAAAPAEASAAHAAATEAAGDLLLLDATVNATPTGELLSVVRTADGRFVARASELRRLRIRIDDARVRDDRIALDAIAGLSFRYDEADQAIALQVADPALDPYRVALGTGRLPADLDAIRPIPGAVLGYGLYATRTRRGAAVSGSAELVGMTAFGILATNLAVNSRPQPGARAVVRLDSSWRHVDPRTVRSYTLGDFASNALSWTNSLRLGGVQVASAFEQRPDLVTTPLPRFSGTAALPSTLDLYVDQQRVYSGAIPAGPFDVRSLPQVSGGKVRLVTTDINGRQVELTRSYYYVPGQLERGLLEFSIDLGFPRQDYGVRSFGYDRILAGSGSARYGLTSATTVEGHAELSSDGLVNAGLGIVQAVGGAGALTASVAGSRYGGGSGARIAVQAEGRIGGLRVYAGTERSFGDYFDLARVSAVRDARRLGVGGFGDILTRAGQARTVNRAGATFSPARGGLSVNLSYNEVRDPGYRQRIANLALSRPISDRISAYASAYADLDRRGFGLFATVNVRLGRSTSVTAGLDRDGGRTAFSVQAEGLAGQRQGDLGWGVRNRVVDGGADQRDAYLSYRAPQAFIRAHVAQDGGQWRAGVDVEGSLVAAGGGLFLANRVGNGFVIVRNAGPGTEVIQGGVRMGRADRAGRMLLPDVLPYYPQQMFLDPATLEDGWEPAATERIAVTGYRQGAVVDFGARRIHGAVVLLRDRSGRPLAAGHAAALEGGETAMVGYDGETYVRGLGPRNRLSVDLGPADRCVARFDYDVDGPPQPRIGPVTCE